MMSKNRPAVKCTFSLTWIPTGEGFIILVILVYFSALALYLWILRCGNQIFVNGNANFLANAILLHTSNRDRKLFVEFIFSHSNFMQNLYLSKLSEKTFKWLVHFIAQMRWYVAAVVAETLHQIKQNKRKRKHISTQ